MHAQQQNPYITKETQTEANNLRLHAAIECHNSLILWTPCSIYNVRQRRGAALY